MVCGRLAVSFLDASERKPEHVRRCFFPGVDAHAVSWESPRVTAVADAIAKMQTLSEERAARVVSLIEDLADLEAREDAEDLAAARAALARIAAGEAPVPWEKVKAELDALHGHD